MSICESSCIIASSLVGDVKGFFSQNSLNCNSGLCQKRIFIEKSDRPGGASLLEAKATYHRRAGVTMSTGIEAITSHPIVQACWVVDDMDGTARIRSARSSEEEESCPNRKKSCEPGCNSLSGGSSSGTPASGARGAIRVGCSSSTEKVRANHVRKPRGKSLPNC